MDGVVNSQRDNQGRVHDGLREDLLLERTTLILCQIVQLPVSVPRDSVVEPAVKSQYTRWGEENRQHHNHSKDETSSFLINIVEVTTENKVLSGRRNRVRAEGRRGAAVAAGVVPGTPALRTGRETWKDGKARSKNSPAVVGTTLIPRLAWGRRLLIGGWCVKDAGRKGGHLGVILAH